MVAAWVRDCIFLLLLISSLTAIGASQDLFGDFNRNLGNFVQDAQRTVETETGKAVQYAGEQVGEVQRTVQTETGKAVQYAGEQVGEAQRTVQTETGKAVQYAGEQVGEAQHNIEREAEKVARNSRGELYMVSSSGEANIEKHQELPPEEEMDVEDADNINNKDIYNRESAPTIVKSQAQNFEEQLDNWGFIKDKIMKSTGKNLESREFSQGEISELEKRWLLMPNVVKKEIIKTLVSESDFVIPATYTSYIDGSLRSYTTIADVSIQARKVRVYTPEDGFLKTILDNKIIESLKDEKININSIHYIELNKTKKMNQK
jgi:hypothetical protein